MPHLQKPDCRLVVPQVRLRANEYHRGALVPLRQLRDPVGLYGSIRFRIDDAETDEENVAACVANLPQGAGVHRVLAGGITECHVDGRSVNFHFA